MTYMPNPGVREDELTITAVDAAGSAPLCAFG